MRVRVPAEQPTIQNEDGAACRRLLAAVVHQAVKDFLRKPGCASDRHRVEHERKSAWRFLFDSGTSFAWMASVLGLDVVACRDALLKQKREHNGG